MKFIKPGKKNFKLSLTLMVFLVLEGAALACQLPFLSPVQKDQDALATELALSLPTQVDTPTALPTPRRLGDFESLMRKDNAPAGKLRDMWLAADETLWVTSDSGVYILQNQTWQQVLDRPANHIWGMDQGGRVWVLLEDGAAIVSFESLRPVVYGPDQGWAPLAPMMPYLRGVGDGLVTDKKGNIWLATGQDDLRRFDTRQNLWTSLRSDQIGLSPAFQLDMDNNLITDVALDREGRLWVSSCVSSGELMRGQTVQVYDGNNWFSIPETQGQCVLDMEAAPGGDIWVGGFDALLHYDGISKAWNKIALPSFQRQQIVFSIDVDAAQRPWVEVGLGGGASLWGAAVRYHLEGTQWVEDLNPNAWLLSYISFGPQGQTWLCGEGNIYRYQAGKMTRVEKIDTYDCRVSASKQGQVYIAALEGPDAGIWQWLKE
ncbi:MAG: hypothetical protein LWX83_00470 [Anaerolineae bacterium]|nr:hypothetical protein [Anaerolineae bacterium]